jgi:hypothetical protein
MEPYYENYLAKVDDKVDDKVDNYNNYDNYDNYEYYQQLTLTSDQGTTPIQWIILIVTISVLCIAGGIIYYYMNKSNKFNKLKWKNWKSDSSSSTINSFPLNENGDIIVGQLSFKNNV